MVIVVSDEILCVQDVWRCVHEEGAAAGLDASGMNTLRRWTGDRMQTLSFAVFNKGSRTMRASFQDAIRIAAADIAGGKVPE